MHIKHDEQNVHNTQYTTINLFIYQHAIYYGENINSNTPNKNASRIIHTTQQHKTWALALLV